MERGPAVGSQLPLSCPQLAERRHSGVSGPMSLPVQVAGHRLLHRGQVWTPEPAVKGRHCKCSDLLFKSTLTSHSFT